MTSLFSKWNGEDIRKNSGETDTSVLRNHLLMCADKDLRKTLHKLHGNSLQTMSLEELIAAIEKTAVEKQSSLLNLVELLELTQNREEAIKKFVARVCGKTNICDLTTQCLRCNEYASFSDEAILAAVVRGLYDSETMAELLSKVDQLDLDDMILFIEAKETGHKSASALVKPSTHTQAVKIDGLVKCTRCGEQGHSPKDGVKVLKTKCRA